MTDAPNFGTKFGRRKPCLRYIGPSLGTACVTPVGRGDLTPPPWNTSLLRSPVGGGLCPAPLGKVCFRANFRYRRNAFPLRVGADPCVRPWACPVKDRTRADTQVGPYKTYIDPSKTRRGQSPAPTVLSWWQAVGRRT